MKRIADFDVALGRRLRLYRVQAGFSQTEVAEALGVTFQQIQKYESGANRISAGRLLQIARLLTLPVATLVEGFEEPDAPTAVPGNSAHREAQDFILTKEGQRLVRAFIQIANPETRRSTLRMLESLSAKDEPS